MSRWTGFSIGMFISTPYPRRDSSLSAILERADDVDDKYFLSKKACLGILRRAEARGKILPKRLQEALEIQAEIREILDTESSSEAEMFNDVASTLRAGAGAPKHLSDILGRLVCQDADGERKVTDSEDAICLNDQGGQSMGVSVGKVSTLRAEAHGNVPIVLGFSTQASVADNAPVLVDRTPTMRTATKLGICYVPKKENEPNNDIVQMKTESDNGIADDDPQVFGVCSKNSNAMKSDNPNSGFYKADTVRTIDTNGANPNCNQGGMVIAYSIAGNTIDRKLKNGGNGKGVLKEKSYTLNTIDRHAVALLEKDDDGVPDDGEGNGTDDMVMMKDASNQSLASGKKVFGCLTANCSTKLWLGNQEAFSGDYFIINRKRRVRRLTPLECERLQGLPDYWTLFDGKRCSDGARYKALGNGMAQPCPDWVVFRICECDK